MATDLKTDRTVELKQVGFSSEGFYYGYVNPQWGAMKHARNARKLFFISTSGVVSILPQAHKFALLSAEDFAKIAIAANQVVSDMAAREAATNAQSF